MIFHLGMIKYFVPRETADDELRHRVSRLMERFSVIQWRNKRPEFSAVY